MHLGALHAQRNVGSRRQVLRFQLRNDSTGEKSNLSAEPVEDGAKGHALRQYNDTLGHFSLVRFVENCSQDPQNRRRLGVFATRVGREQEFPSCRPRNDHERCLWQCILHLLFGQVSRDERPGLSMDPFVVPTRRMYVLFIRRKDCAVEEGEQYFGSGAKWSCRPRAHNPLVIFSSIHQLAF